jgi:hypothetical protein
MAAMRRGMRYALLLKIMDRNPRDLPSYSSTLFLYFVHFAGPHIDGRGTASATISFV